MADARARGWGWPDDPGYRSRHIVTITSGGIRLNIRREVAHLFAGFVDGLVAGGYRLDVVADDWGWNNRDIRGRPGVKSNHAWGLAIDVNSTHNPMTEAHPGHAGAPGHDGRGVHTDMPAWVGPLARRWGLTWGANYTGSRKDCLTGDTMLVTIDGPIPIRELAGREVELLSTTTDPRCGVVESQWVKAPVEAFGFDHTFAVALRRRGGRITVRTTARHRWPVMDKAGTVRFVTTTEIADGQLRQGDRVPALTYPASEVVLHPDAVASGIVWGDGSVYNRHGGRTPQAKIELCGPKVELRPWVEPHARYWRATAHGEAAWGLPARFKELPHVDSAVEILAGFFAGWFATDGHVNPDSVPTLSSSNPVAVSWLRRVAPRLGLTITSVSIQAAGRSGFGSTRDNHQVAFRAVPDHLLLRDQHRTRHPGERQWHGWTVESVEPTGLVEEVFCPIVSGRHVVAIDTPTVPLLTGQSMHFEFVGSPQDVARYPLPGTHQEPTPRSEEDDMHVTATVDPGKELFWVIDAPALSNAKRGTWLSVIARDAPTKTFIALGNQKGTRGGWVDVDMTRYSLEVQPGDDKLYIGNHGDHQLGVSLVTSPR